MRMRMLGDLLWASALALLLTSCVSTHHVPSPSVGEFADFVLIIGEGQNGQVTHSWRRATEVDLRRYALPGSTGGIVLVSRRPRDCDQEQIACVRDCMKRRRPSHESHINHSNGNKYGFCQTKCLLEYHECLEVEKARSLQFSTGNDAVEWLKQNRRELLAGTIVVIAGVAFVALSAGAGFAILAPVVLVAS
jgi:hypothetical protein